FCRVADSSLRTRHQRYAVRFGRRAGGDLAADHAHGVAGRTDKHESGFYDAVCEVSILGEETVAGMDGVGACDARRFQYLLDRQVALGRRCRPDADGFVGVTYVQGLTVGFRIHGHGGNAHFTRRTHDADGDLATVGDKYFFYFTHV